VCVFFPGWLEFKTLKQSFKLTWPNVFTKTLTLPKCLRYQKYPPSNLWAWDTVTKITRLLSYPLSDESVFRSFLLIYQIVASLDMLDLLNLLFWNSHFTSMGQSSLHNYIVILWGVQYSLWKIRTRIALHLTLSFPSCNWVWSTSHLHNGQSLC
jgi:hypothetical protein